MIGFALGHQLRGHFGMMRGVLGLEHHVAIMLKAEPAHPLENFVDGILGGPLHIRVFDPQDELSAVMAGKQPVEQGSTGAADMQIAGWGRGETGNNSHIGRGSVAEKLGWTLL